LENYPKLCSLKIILLIKELIPLLAHGSGIMGRKFTDEELKLLANLGYSRKEMAELLNCSYDTVCVWIRRLGLKVKRRMPEDFYPYWQKEKAREREESIALRLYDLLKSEGMQNIISLSTKLKVRREYLRRLIKRNSELFAMFRLVFRPKSHYRAMTREKVFMPVSRTGCRVFVYLRNDNEHIIDGLAKIIVPYNGQKLTIRNIIKYCLKNHGFSDYVITEALKKRGYPYRSK